MIEYRCTNCHETYRSDEYDDLERVLVDPEYPKSGYERKCAECGSRFHTEKWNIQDELDIGDSEAVVTTFGLHVPHGLNHDEWYETTIYHSEVGERIEDRHETEQEAIDGHSEIVDLLLDGQFHFEPTGRKLVLESET